VRLSPCGEPTWRRFLRRPSPPPAPTPGGRRGEGKDEEAASGVGSFLFETEAEGYDELEGADVRVEAAPAGPVGGEDEGVAELIEETGPEIEEAPDLEAVEAAAEHFAGSMREEAGIEEEPLVPPATEEIAIAELLGEEGAGALA
jgi:hypothetical protein